MTTTTLAVIRRLIRSTDPIVLASNMTGHLREIYDDIMDYDGLSADIEVPIIPDLFTTIKQHLDTNKDAGIDMAIWHGCGSVHCLAGWMIHLAPYKMGYDLVNAIEDELSVTGEGIAGILIFLASCPWSVSRWPAFFPLEYACRLSEVNGVAREYVNTMAAKEQAIKQEGASSEYPAYLPND